MENARPELTFRFDKKPIARRSWAIVPRVGETVYLNDPMRRDDMQHAASVLWVGYYDTKEIRRFGGLRVDIDVEWLDAD